MLNQNNKVMTQSSTKMTLIKSVLENLRIHVGLYVKMKCGNKTATNIANNMVFHERIKHIEVDCHYIRDFVQVDIINTMHLKS